MAQVIALYKTPANAAAFDAYYYGSHVPLAKTLPGLRGYEVSAGPVVTPAGPAPFHLVALLQFDSLAAVKAALASKEGMATAADLANFAQAGVDLLIFDTKPV